MDDELIPCREDLIRNFEVVMESIDEDIVVLEHGDLDPMDRAILYASCQERNELCSALLNLAASMEE